MGNFPNGSEIEYKRYIVREMEKFLVKGLIHRALRVAKISRHQKLQCSFIRLTVALHIH